MPHNLFVVPTKVPQALDISYTKHIRLEDSVPHTDKDARAMMKMAQQRLDFARAVGGPM